MNSLTIALSALGGVVLAGIVAHGAWSAHKAGPKRAQRSPASEADRAGYRDPVMEPLDGGKGASTALPPDASEAVVAAAAEAALAAGAERRPARRVAPRLDALIDAIAPLRVEAAVAGAVAVAHLPASRRAGAKPLLIEGVNDETGAWETPSATSRYREFQAGVQLANRSGPLNEIEYSEFVQKVQAYADGIGAMADFPDMLEVVASARELDAFASQHDAQLAVHLRARGPAWSIGYIQQHAGRHGFVPGVVPGRLVLPSAEEGVPPVLTLTFDSQAAFADDPNLAALRDVTLAFDVPQTDPAADPYAAWSAGAQALALGMEADLVDDQGQPIRAEGFHAIATELARLYAALQARDLAAGTPAARRLFS
jgi:hypothetical protein